MSGAAREIARQNPTVSSESPRDHVFEAWEREESAIERDGFVWLPEHGMGRLRVSDPPYDQNYFENYVRMAGTPMGRALTSARVDVVRRHTDGHVVDVGIGCGAFIAARMGWTWGYDVNPAGIAWLHSTGRWCDPYEAPVDAVSLWDVLEHIPDPLALLRNVRRWVFMSLPIVPGDGPPTAEWKHYKPREHCWYWTAEGMVRWMAAHGFELRHRSAMETRLGRQDIGTFVFQRAAPFGETK